MDLFDQINSKQLRGTPLAERLRPQRVSEVVGQNKAIGPGTLFSSYLSQKRIPSLILWGPPGTGKTSFSLALANELDAEFFSLSAIETGAKELKRLGEEARQRRRERGAQSLFFVDEIHRYNKAQQDVLLPFVERGDFILVGATTENPSYELNRALLSRCMLIVFESLDKDGLRELFEKALKISQIVTSQFLKEEAREWLLDWSDGDGRRLLNATESLIAVFGQKPQSFPLATEDLPEILGTAPIAYDKNSDEHYNIISAFIKSIRGSDPDAGLYYLARMLEGGEDPKFIARRLVILASEDVGNADPRALSVAVAGAQAVELIGLPEASINLAQVVTYLASAPKSNRSYLGIKKAQAYVKETGARAIPMPLRSSKKKEMKELGYGKGYKYPHDYPKHWVKQEYLPKEVRGESFYEPSSRGFEKNIQTYLNWLKSNEE